MSVPAAAPTAWLSVLLGAYLVAGGIGVSLRGHLWSDMLDDFNRSPGLTAITGMAAFAIGAVIVSVHNVWTGPAAIIVSAVGWIAVAEGLALLAMPDLYLRLVRPLIGAPRIWGTGLILVGAFLLATALTSGVAGPIS